MQRKFVVRINSFDYKCFELELFEEEMLFRYFKRIRSKCTWWVYCGFTCVRPFPGKHKPPSFLIWYHIEALIKKLAQLVISKAPYKYCPHKFLTRSKSDPPHWQPISVAMPWTMLIKYANVTGSNMHQWILSTQGAHAHKGRSHHVHTIRHIPCSVNSRCKLYSVYTPT